MNREKQILPAVIDWEELSSGSVKEGAKRRYLLNTQQVKAAAIWAVVLGVEC